MSEKASSTIKGISPTEIHQQRFWKHVFKSEGGCWLWKAACQKGYGVFSINHKSFRAHRVAYYLVNGSIPDGSLICHHCDNPSCVNPKHLFIGTAQANMDDAIKKGRTASGERCARARLTKQQVIRIRKLIEQSVPLEQIGKRFQVTKQSIWAICHRVTWKHI